MANSAKKEETTAQQCISHFCLEGREKYWQDSKKRGSEDGQEDLGGDETSGGNVEDGGDVVHGQAD